MDSPLKRISPQRKKGGERFRVGQAELDFDLHDFWCWSSSDLVSNATRGVLAEYLVARALGVAQGWVRDEWAPYDLITPEGIKVEVKSAAFLQSWHQRRLSGISFLVKKTRKWDPETNTLTPEKLREADVYVFALLAHRDKLTVDPMDLAQWEFFVLPTSVLNDRRRSQHSISLSSLRRLAPSLKYHQIAQSVSEAADHEKQVD